MIHKWTAVSSRAFLGLFEMPADAVDEWIDGHDSLGIEGVQVVDRDRFGRRRLRARGPGPLASSLDFLQGSFEKIHLQGFVRQHPLELMQLPAERGLR